MPLEVFRPEPDAPPQPQLENFAGEVRAQNMHQATGAQSVEALIVHFAAGARTRPHSHPGEQILHFVRGSGFVQLEGQPEQRVPEGGVVIVPAGVLHMHGATGEEPVSHVAIRAANGPTDWDPEEVPEEWAQWRKS